MGGQLENGGGYRLALSLLRKMARCFHRFGGGVGLSLVGVAAVVDVVGIGDGAEVGGGKAF